MYECECCEQRKEDVTFRNDPYLEDVEGIVVPLWLCDACWVARCVLGRKGR